MRSKRAWLLLSLVLVFVWAGLCHADGFSYSKKEHPGGDLTPSESFEKVQADPQNTVLIDVRTRAEYVFVGHPVGAYNLPVKYFDAPVGKPGNKMVLNENFAKELAAKFDKEKTTFIFMCRSGGRSVDALNICVEAGYKADKLFNMVGGFEGGKIKNKNSAYDGKRALGGWKNEGLPWTYHVDEKLAY